MTYITDKETNEALVKAGKMKRKHRDIDILFWKKYRKLDYFKKEEHIRFIIQNIMGLEKLKGENKRRCMATLLMSYFDDLINYMDSEK